VVSGNQQALRAVLVSLLAYIIEARSAAPTKAAVAGKRV
jgi:hypothetical protein